MRRGRITMPYSILIAQTQGIGPYFIWGCSILYLVLTAGCVIYVWNDCHRGNIPGLGWSILALLTSVVGLVIYMIYKSFLPDRGWRG